MKLAKWTLLLVVVFMTIPEPVWAVALSAAAGGKSPSSNGTGIISRGGTITAVGATSKTLTVDDITYSFVAGSENIRVDYSSVAAPIKLQVGTKVRFNTEKDSVGGRERIVDIWITRTGNSVQKK